MNSDEQKTVGALAAELADDVKLGKEIVTAYKTGGKAAVLAMLPAIVKEAKEDFEAFKVAAPTIKAGYKTSEFWIALILLGANAALFAWKDKTLPFDVNATIAVVMSVYIAVRGLIKKPDAPK